MSVRKVWTNLGVLKTARCCRPFGEPIQRRVFAEVIATLPFGDRGEDSLHLDAPRSVAANQKTVPEASGSVRRRPYAFGWAVLL